MLRGRLTRSIPAGEVAWYVTGRFYLRPDGHLHDVGYFLHLQGLHGEMFSGPPGEGTAHFTFSSTPFHATSIANGGLSIGLDSPGFFEVFLQRRPAATFEHPATFAAGEPVASFRRVSLVASTTVQDASQGGLVSLNVFTAALVWSKTFIHGGRRQNLGRLLRHGITQWGTASGQGVPAPAGYTSAVPFVGSAIAVGGRRALAGR